MNNVSLENFKEGFLNPPIEYWPRTRWWWHGNAVTKEEIAWELQQMHDKGIGGVEISSIREVYEKGNIPYLSEEWLKIVKYTIQTAKKLGMSVALSFVPGWPFGGFWVKPEDRSQSMVSAYVDVEGPKVFSGPIPEYKVTKISYAATDKVPTRAKLISVIAGRVFNNNLEENSLMDISSKVVNKELNWKVPAGNWRIMAFYLKFTGQQNSGQNYKPENWTLDHFNRAAVKRYCNYLGEKFYKTFGNEFGKSVDSLFCDSFEIVALANGIYWSDDLLEGFKQFKGYDLTRYLSAIWWDIGELTPKIRHDINEFLHHVGIEALFKPFLSWCKEHNVEARIQPYHRFTTEIIESAGLTHRPECEICNLGFYVEMNVRKSVTSGAHLYGRKIVSAEAYTYLYFERYRSTLEELKIAGDAYIRDGVNQFYNHGYNYSPEKEVSPARSFCAAHLISHPNIWWKYYPYLSKYLSRVFYLLQKGEPTADIALYSPYHNAWAEKVIKGTISRNLPFETVGRDLGRTLVANGYDFDWINDDILLNHAKVQEGKIRIRNMKYKFLILPNIKVIPLKTIEFIRNYVKNGGIVIALDNLPDNSTGLKNYKEKDDQVKRITNELFRQEWPAGRKDYGQGHTYYLRKIIISSWRPRGQQKSRDELIKILRDNLAPDFALEGMKESSGLTFVHRKMNDIDIYFITNLQDKPSDIPVIFRVQNKLPEEWNPYTGKVSQIYQYEFIKQGIRIPIHLNAYESTFILFKTEKSQTHITQTNLTKALNITENQIIGLTNKNGVFMINLNKDGNSYIKTEEVKDLPAPYSISGSWRLTFEGKDFPKITKTITSLTSWTKDPKTKYFSGTARYELDFNLPTDYIKSNIELILDLGKVCNVAEVELNHKKIGVAWIRPYQLSITEIAKEGTNHLVVLITNTLINRVAGFKRIPPVPEELVPQYGSTADYALKMKCPEIGFRPLSSSGLMGPVKIIPIKKVAISM